MPDISTVKLPGDNNTYYIKDSTARSGLSSKSDVGHTHTVSEITDFHDANTFRGIMVDGVVQVGRTTEKDINFIAGDNISLQHLDETASFGLRIDATNTNTWRNMTVNGSAWKGTGTSSGAANFKAGNNISLAASGNDLTISASLPGGGMQFQGVAASEAAIKAKTAQTKGSVWLAEDTHEEWLCTADIGGTASASSWEKLGGAYGALAYVDTASASYTPAGSIAAGTGSAAPGTASVYSITAVGSLPTHANDTFTQGSFTQGSFSQGSLPSWTASVSNEILTIGWSAGTLPTHGSDSFTKPTFTQGTFSQGSLPTKGNAQTVLTSIGTPKFTGTAATITVTPD
jgi:hypothetical protein